MCKLVPFKAQTGKTVMVADIKVDKLNKYLEMFPKLTSIDKVVLFGTALSDRCTEESALDLLLFYNDKFQYDMSITLLDEFPDSCYDATLGIGAHRYGTRSFTERPPIYLSLRKVLYLNVTQLFN